MSKNRVNMRSLNHDLHTVQYPYHVQLLLISVVRIVISGNINHCSLSFPFFSSWLIWRLIARFFLVLFLHPFKMWSHLTVLLLFVSKCASYVYEFARRYFYTSWLISFQYLFFLSIDAFPTRRSDTTHLVLHQLLPWKPPLSFELTSEVETKALNDTATIRSGRQFVVLDHVITGTLDACHFITSWVAFIWSSGCCGLGCRTGPIKSGRELKLNPLRRCYL